jgi:hypothetical protein
MALLLLLRHEVMPRRVRVAEGGFVFHVINRAAKKARLFESYADYNSLEEILAQAKPEQVFDFLHIASCRLIGIS